ncbi:ATP-dependent helicase HrpB [Colwellia sp. MSW7]|uniref:ATP-dependent helicase HrpB n=1 Tax=Colwellia maritima TaxID=2912588 RepID=A0ABS9X6P5_9GAMM|nr:ATP-dependent helicase HrpB [Colwellia maritima]MCI2285750.1 ATP-dependent helicase HrpB [Colwellia maritima]
MSTSLSLPIEAIKTQFCQALSKHHTVILSAPPGAGKSTCLPLWLLRHEAFAGQKIYLLQPRRLAVKNIASYLAFQLNEQVGETVGYRIRNDTKISKSTRLEVITEGILTQIIQQDAELSDCALVVFDEFHERSLQGDLAFALSRDIQQGLRDDLHILLMSATLAIDNIAKAIPDAELLVSEGRSYPVDIVYDAPQNNHRRDHALNVIKKHAKAHEGSILVFLPGVADIRFIANALAEVFKHFPVDDLLLCPLFGDLTLKQQQQAIEPCQPGFRKLVLATNIAETSLTIEGVNLVIDCGLEKVAIYDGASLMNKLVQKNIAKASAIQRAGRAGRLMAGVCIRLYAQDDFERRPEHSVNDIMQADLLPTIIEAARWGVNQLAELPLLELPTPIKEQQAWQELKRLSIVNKQNQLTAHGEQVAQFPCHPRFAHMILSSNKLSSTRKQQEHLSFLACVLAALLEERDVFSGEQSRFDCNIAHRVSKLISAFNQPYGTLVNIVKQVNSLAKRVGLQNSNLLATQHLPLDCIGLLLAYAYPERIAKARGATGDFICANGKGVTLNEQDALAGEQFLVIADLMQTQQVPRVRLAASIELSQLEHWFKPQIVEQEMAVFDERSGKIIARNQTKFDALVLQESVSRNMLSAETIITMWCELITRKGLTLLNWQAKDLALKARWNWLTRYFPEYELPQIDDETLLVNLESRFSPFVGEIKSMDKLTKLDISTMLLSQLDYQQQQILKQAAPEDLYRANRATLSHHLFN